jgi:cell division protein FtsQ
MTSEPAGDPVPRPSRLRRRLIIIGVLIVATSPWWATPLLKRMDYFRVRHVEVRGARFTSPEEVLRRVAVDTTFSIWNDLGPLEERLSDLKHVESIRISRRFPATLVVRLQEFEPVALVPSSSGFKPFDASGRQLPFDPTRTTVDLPVIPRADTLLLRFLGEVRAADPALFARVSELRRSGTNELVMQLVTVPVRLRPDVSMDRLAQISSVEGDLTRRNARVLEIDLRFRDQVIARLQ